MAGAFNPYEEWLELPAGLRPENYYALLGLATFENDPKVIAHAADGLRSRVRRIRPGPHMAEWQALLDEVAAAKTCLLDAKAKASYDAQLRNPSRAKTRPVSPPQSAPQPAFQPPPPPPWLQKPPPPAAQPAFQEPPPPAWLQQAQTPAPDAAFQPPPPPAWLQSPQPPQGYPEPPQAWPTAQPAFPQYSAPMPQQMYAPRAPSRRRARSDEPSLAQRIAGPLIVVSFVGAAVGGYVAFRVLRDREYTVAADATVSVVAPTTTTSDKAEPTSGSESKPEAASAAPAAKDSADLKATPKAEPVARPPVDSPKPPADAMSGPAATVMAGDPMSAPASTGMADPGMSAPKPETANPAVATPAAGKPPAGDPAKQAELVRALKAARLAMGRRNLAEAKRELEKARANTQSPDDEDRVTRYENLGAFLTEFWKGVAKRLGTFKPMDEVELAKSRIIVVEASGEEIRFKSGGRVFHYRIDTMPIPFIAGLVEGALNDAPSKVIFGAFLAVEPQGNAERAAELWQQAAEAGEKIEQLLPPMAELIASREVGAPQAGGGAAAKTPTGGGDQFAAELAALQDKGQKASEASDQMAVAKQAMQLGQNALKSGALDEAVRIARFAGEMAEKARNSPLARQATTLERKAEAALKRKSK